MDLSKMTNKTELQRQIQANPVGITESVWQLIQQVRVLKKTVKEVEEETEMLEHEIARLRAMINV